MNGAQPKKSMTLLEGEIAGLRARLTEAEERSSAAAAQVLEERRINAKLLEDTEAMRAEETARRFETAEARNRARRDAVETGRVLAERTTERDEARAERDEARTQYEDIGHYHDLAIEEGQKLQKKLDDFQPLLLLFVATRFVTTIGGVGTRTISYRKDSPAVTSAKKMLDKGFRVAIDFIPSIGETMISFLDPDHEDATPPWLTPPAEDEPTSPTFALPVFE